MAALEEGAALAESLLLLTASPGSTIVAVLVSLLPAPSHRSPELLRAASLAVQSQQRSWQVTFTPPSPLT